MPSGGGGGGGGTPNVAIAGTDASGLPIASPVLAGNDSLDNVTLIGGNTNTGFRSVVFGTNNTNGGDNSLVTGQANQNAGQKNIIGGGNNNVNGYENGVSGSNNTIDLASDRNGVSGANNSLTRSDSNDVSGEGNQLIDSSANSVSGYNHYIINNSIQNRVSGNNHTLNNVVNSEVSGYSHDIAPLSGSGADYNDISGNDHLIRGDYNRVSGGSNTVQTTGANVHGTGHVVEGGFSDVNGASNRVGPDGVNGHAEGNFNDATGAYSHVQGQGNTAKFAQHVAGRYAVTDPVAGDTSPTNGQQVEIIGWGVDDSNRDTIRYLRDDGAEFLKKGILGKTSYAPDGIVGQVKSTKIEWAAAVNLPDNTDTAIMSLSLPPGVWRLDYRATFRCAGVTYGPSQDTIIWIKNAVNWVESDDATTTTYVMFPVGTAMNVVQSYELNSVDVIVPPGPDVIYYANAYALIPAGTISVLGKFVATRIY